MMTDTPGNPDAARVFQAWRTAAIGRVTQMLDGSGLEIKELANGCKYSGNPWEITLWRLLAMME